MENITARLEQDMADNACELNPASMRAGLDGCGTPVPLRLVREGEWVRIVSLAGYRGFCDRLAGLGLFIGTRLKVIRNPFDGKLLLGHERTRLFLGGGMAQKIQVVIVEGRSQ